MLAHCGKSEAAGVFRKDAEVSKSAENPVKMLTVGSSGVGKLLGALRCCGEQVGDAQRSDDIDCLGDESHLYQLEQSGSALAVFFGGSRIRHGEWLRRVLWGRVRSLGHLRSETAIHGYSIAPRQILVIFSCNPT